jgi:hypothetical protein
MGRVEELRARYDAVSEAIEDGLFELDVRQFCSGPTLVEVFGRNADSLDVICLLAALARVLPTSIGDQIGLALNEGHSWNEIAAALGVSRQAAVKRFGGFGPDSIPAPSPES